MERFFAFIFVCSADRAEICLCVKKLFYKNEMQMKQDELLDFGEDSRQSPYVVRDGFFVKTDEKWEKLSYDEILWVRAFENGSVIFLTDERNKMVNHRLWRIEEMLQEHKNFVRINRSEIVNLDAVDGFEGRSALPLGLSKNCYYIGKNPLYATGDYRQRMEGVFVKAKQQ